MRANTVLKGLGVFIFLGSEANALVGDRVFRVNPSDAPSVCKITIHRDESEDLCSGTLISPFQVVTAAHCFGRYFHLMSGQVSVQCGGKYAGEVREVELPDSKDRSLWLNRDTPRKSLDQAILDFYDPVPSTPSAVAKNTADFFGSNFKLLPSVECALMGFGRDHSGILGNLNELDVSQLSLTFINQARGMLEANVIYLSPIQTSDLRDSVDHGDSGGPLFCHQPGEADHLVGITGGYEADQRSGNRVWDFFHPAWQL